MMRAKGRRRCNLTLREESTITRSYRNEAKSPAGIAGLAQSTAVELFAGRLLALATGVVNSSLEKRTLV